MSESSEEKTKRKYLAALRNHEWSYQHSVFYDKPEMSVHLLDDMAKFKQRLSRLYPDQAFLIRVQELQKGAVRQVFLSIITTALVERIEDIVARTFPMPMNVMSRPLTAEKLGKMAGTIERQAPHSLAKFFSKDIVHRWSVLNARILETIRTVGSNAATDLQ